MSESASQTTDVLNQAVEVLENVCERIKRLERRQQKRLKRAQDELLTICEKHLPEISSLDEAKEVLRIMPWYTHARAVTEARVCEIYTELLNVAPALEVIDYLRDDFHKIFWRGQYQKSEHFDTLSKIGSENIVRIVENRIQATADVADVYALWEEVRKRNYSYSLKSCVQRVLYFIPREQLTHRKMSQKRLAALCRVTDRSWPFSEFYGEIMLLH